MAFDYRRLSRRARHLMRRLKRTKHASVQQVTVHELNNEIHRRRFGRAARTAEPAAARLGHWRPLTRRAKKLLTQLGRAKVWVIQRRLVKELVTEMENGRRFLATRVHKAKRRLTRAARPLVRGKRAVGRAIRSRRTWRATGRTWQSVRQPGSRERQFSATRAGRRWHRQNARRDVPGSVVTRVRRQRQPRPAPAPARTAPAPGGRLAPGSTRPAPARTARTRS
jgi:hypothetical protein